MIYLIDTNVCITYLKVPHSAIAARLAQIPPSDIATCSVVKLELMHGALRSANPARALSVLRAFLEPFVSLPLDDQAAEIGGQIRADLETRGLPIGPYDLQIAAIAVANNLTVVTHNTREFTRVTGLRIEDWQQE